MSCCRYHVVASHSGARGGAHGVARGGRACGGACGGWRLGPTTGGGREPVGGREQLSTHELRAELSAELGGCRRRAAAAVAGNARAGCRGLVFR